MSACVFRLWRTQNDGRPFASLRERLYGNRTRTRSTKLCATVDVGLAFVSFRNREDERVKWIFFPFFFLLSFFWGGEGKNQTRKRSKRDEKSTERNEKLQTEKKSWSLIVDRISIWNARHVMEPDRNCSRGAFLFLLLLLLLFYLISSLFYWVFFLSLSLFFDFIVDLFF